MVANYFIKYFYKFKSGCLNLGLKPILVLIMIISDTLSGFMKGRYIRFANDIMAYTESEHIPGLLVMIDFEKAFDSISWSYIYKVLNYLNYID